MLDVDNVISLGPEHYTTTCDSAALQVGTYRIKVNNYRAATGGTATLQIASYIDGVLLIRTLGVGAELGSSGNNNPVPVFNVT